MPNDRKKLIRITTVPSSLRFLLRNQLRFMNRHFEVVAVSSPGAYLAEVAMHEQVRTASVPMKRAIAPFSDLVSIFRLYRLIRRENPSVVHTHTPKAGLVGMAAAALARVPVRIHTVAGLPLMEARGIKKLILLIVEALMYRLANRVYPNSHHLRSYILKKGLCSEEKLKVIAHGSSNGVDLNHYSVTEDVIESAAKWKRRLHLRDEFVFVFIGRLVRDKGIMELVQAFKELRARFTHIRLLLVGVFEHELDPLDDATIMEIKTGDRISLVDWQEDIRPLLALSNVLVFPSYREGFPNVPMQAGALGIPAVVTDINGCNEIVEDGVNGLIVSPKNVVELQAAMERLIVDKSVYEHMRSVARERIMNYYDQGMLWNALLEEYMLLMQPYDIRKVPKEIVGSAV